MPWVVVATVLIVCLPLGFWIKLREAPGWIRAVQWAGIILLTAEFLNWTHSCWPGEGAEFVVPLVLLLLAEHTAEMGWEKASRASGILRFGIYGAFLIILLSGVQEIWLPNLRIMWMIPSAGLITVCLLPVLWNPKEKNPQIGLRIGAEMIICAVVGTGVLGLGGDFYTLSGSLSYMGSALRFESLAAAAMTMGFYALLSFLLCCGGDSWQETGNKDRKTGIRIAAAAGMLLYMLPIRIDSWISVGYILIAHIILPLWIKIKNYKKGG